MHRVRINRYLGVLTTVLAAMVSLPARGGDQTVYDDLLQSGWNDWSWANVNLFHMTTVHSGTRSISVDLGAINGYEALYLNHTAQDADDFTDVMFWIHGGPSGGQLVQVVATLSGAAQPAVQIPPLAAGTWQQVTVPLSSLGIAGQTDFDGLWIQGRSGGVQPTFYVDDITLISVPPPTNINVAITVDAALDVHPISPMIYGVAWASASELSELNAPANRAGGNASTRYNWQLNASNRAGDWYFESISDGSSTPGAFGDNHVQLSKTGGAEPMLTVPMIEWMPKLGPSRGKLSSYSIAKYGPQTDNDWQWFPDAGNGISVTGGVKITWNDPTDANYLTDSTFQKQWIEHLTNTWGLAGNGGVRFYCMDNEHTLWHETHRDIHPVGASMEEIRDKLIEYGTKVKDVDPGALLFGPEEWGWNGWLYSGLDLQSPGNPDRDAHGGWEYSPWLLDQLRQHEIGSGQRVLDVFTLHIYPQGGEGGNDASESVQLLRNRSTRSLWDPTYVDASWINSIIRMIPRMHEWVDTHYPGTAIGITEYNWGAEGHINGATAQADIYGIFGREGLDYGTRWTTPNTGTPTFNAMKMYRNYDGSKSTFGDTSVSATGPDPDDVSTFAALRSTDGALTIMVINKHLTATASTTVNLANVSHQAAAEAWQLTSANVITQLSDVPIAGDFFSTVLPAQSITLFVIGAGERSSLHDPAVVSGSTFEFWLDGEAGKDYVIESTSDHTNWPPVQTNTLITTNLLISVPITDDVRSYRAHEVP